MPGFGGPKRKMISVVILTYNSELTIGRTLSSAAKVSDDIFVVDSYSSDSTLPIAAEYGAHIVQHEFVNYGIQRNWAIENLPIRYSWELHLDADEFLSQGLVEEINSLKQAFPKGINGYHIPRLIRFLGRDLRHGGLYPIWHLRLFRHGKGKCETREYDQHFIVAGKTGKLSKPMIDDHQMSLAEWVSRHNKWSSAEVREILGGHQETSIKGSLTGSAIQRQRALRRYYIGMPLFIRPLLLFLYRYILRLGFLDGIEGLIYHILQGFWFRFLIDAKIFEEREKGRVRHAE